MKFIDLSYANGIVDFDKLKADGIDGVLIRASYGTGFTDTQFVRNINEARRVDLLVVFYHFTYPQYNSPEAEASWFISVIKPYLKQGDMLAQDYEEASYTGDADSWARSFEDSVALFLNGYHPIFYSYLSLINEKGFKSVISEGDPLWLAVYDNNPTTTYSTGFKTVIFKQYTDKGVENGVNGNVDEDYFFGTKDDFLKFSYLYQPTNMVHFKVFVMHPNSQNPIQTVYDGMDQDDHSNPVWNTLKDGIINKRIEIQREINGSVVEDVVLDVNSIVAPLNTQIASLTKINNDAATQLNTITDELRKIQTQDGLDQQTIVNLNKQITELTTAISTLKKIDSIQTGSQIAGVNIWSSILQYIISIFHK